MVIVFAIPKWDIDYKKAVDNYNYNDLKGYSETKEPHTGNEYKVYMNVYKGNIYQNSGFVILPKPDDKRRNKKTEWLSKTRLWKSVLSNKEEEGGVGW